MKRPLLTLLSLGLVLTLVLGNRVESADERTPPERAERAAALAVTSAGKAPAAAVSARGPVFDGRMLVAYYGTVGTGALGVLGETVPEKAIARVRRAAAPFRRDGLDAQPVFELIVTIADAHPGKDGDFNHDVDHGAVRRWIDAARDGGALVVLDIQTGRADFPSVAKRWEWALREPHVGLAIDPEWRMRPHQVPGRVIGSVSAWEINLTSRWLQDLTAAQGLPEKLFVVHQFRTDMVRNIGNVLGRELLAEVQHVDGFGTPGQKLATYRTVARPDLFRMGFKLFYDEDIRRMSPARVLQIQPRVDFVSFQ